MRLKPKPLAFALAELIASAGFAVLAWNQLIVRYCCFSVCAEDQLSTLLFLVYLGLSSFFMISSFFEFKEAIKDEN